MRKSLHPCCGAQELMLLWLLASFACTLQTVAEKGGRIDVGEEQKRVARIGISRLHAIWFTL
jgi:hypothetical protein